MHIIGINKYFDFLGDYMKINPTVGTLILCAAVFSASMLGYIFGVQAEKEEPQPERAVFPQLQQTESISVPFEVKETETAVKDFEESYILRAQSGKVSLFIRYANGDEQLYSNYDIPVSLLPKSDREELEKGIKLDSLDEALSLAEDYAG